jgi:Ca2+-binding EF-hand superfamily protein
MLEEMDANEDGKLQLTEISNEQLRERLAAADSDEDGAITQEELDAQRGRGRGQFGGQQVFQRLDTDEDGKVMLTEIPEDRRERFSAADSNEDGELTQAELDTFMQGQSWGQGRRRGPGGPQDNSSEESAQESADESSEAAETPSTSPTQN